MSKRKFLLGVHVSISGGVYHAPERAAALGCDTFQIFPSNPRGWRQKTHPLEDVEEFKLAVTRAKLEPFFVHMPYLPNLAAPDDKLYEKSAVALIEAVEATAEGYLD